MEQFSAARARRILPKDELLRWLRSRRLPLRREPESRGQGSAHRKLRALEGSAADLIAGGSLKDILQRIAARAGSAVESSGHLLVVSLPDGNRHSSSRGAGETLLHACGTGTEFDPAAPVLAGLPPVVVVPIVSAKNSYGVLAAVAKRGRTFLAEDRETLAAYARHAALAMDIAGLLAETQEESETSKLLLDVARTLNSRSSMEAVAQSIADAVPALCGADRSAIALWDPAAGRIRIAAMMGWSGALAEKLRNYVTTEEESPELAQMLANTLPHLVDRNGSDWALRTLDDFEVRAFAATPITAEGQLVGIVLAHWADKPAPTSIEGALTARLEGLAGLAAVALEKIQLLEETRRQALHDPLTGLANRTLLETRLEASLMRAAGTGRRVGLLFCDINRFKRINDSLGHSAGDYVLQQVAARLELAASEQSTVARYSGDEFVILLPDLIGEAEGDMLREVEGIAAIIRLLLGGPLVLEGRELFIDTAIGTAVSGALASVEPAALTSEAQKLVKKADLAMYRSKAQARGHGLAKMHSPYRLRLEADLRGAVGRGEMLVHFQPQIDLLTDEVVAAEALVRWQHPELGLLSPAEFIPLAEESQLIIEVGAHVLAESCRTGAAWRRAGHPVELAVNVSAVQLNAGDFADLVRRVLDRTGFPAEALTLEITESQVMSDHADTRSLYELKTLGVSISIDDFGTGYSSLTQLHQLPVTEIKIDRSFTRAVNSTKPDAFVSGIIGLAHGLGLRIVAEGVESPEQAAALRSLGCNRVQGFLFGKPAQASQFEALLGVGVGRG